MEIDEIKVLSESLTTDSSDAVEIWENCSAWERLELQFYGICEKLSDMRQLHIVFPMKNWGESVEWYDIDGIISELVGYNEYAGYYYLKDVPDEWEVFEKYFIG